jgi:hypothetical protein
MTKVIFFVNLDAEVKLEESPKVQTWREQTDKRGPEENQMNI